MDHQGLALDELISRAESNMNAIASALCKDEASAEGLIEFDIQLNSGVAATHDRFADVSQWLQEPRRCPGTGILLDNTITGSDWEGEVQ